MSLCNERALYPMEFDLPYFFEVVRTDGKPDFGPTVPVDKLAVVELDQLEVELRNARSDFEHESRALQRAIDEARERHEAAA